MAAYMEQRKLITNGLASDSILVVQDFSQLQMNCGFLQTLIIVLYYFQDRELQTVYLDYVGDKGMKNVTFLASKRCICGMMVAQNILKSLQQCISGDGLKLLWDYQKYFDMPRSLNFSFLDTGNISFFYFSPQWRVGLSN